MQKNPYKSPESNSLTNELGAIEKPSILLYAATFIIVLLNILLSVASAYFQGYNFIAFVIGYVSQAFLFPIIVVLILQVVKKFRNQKSRIKIFFWTSFALFVLLLLGLFHYIQKYTSHL